MFTVIWWRLEARSVCFSNYRFPKGQIVIEDDGQLVAAALSMIVNYARFGDVHTYAQITGNGYLTHHDPLGDTLYGVDIFCPSKISRPAPGPKIV